MRTVRAAPDNAAGPPAAPTRGNDMKPAAIAYALLAFLLAASAAPADPPPGLAAKAREVLKANCYRCHGQDGAVEGGFNYVLDRDKLVAARKIVPGKPDDSPLLRKVVAGKMPPPDEKPRPSAADVALLKQWIEAGAPARPRAGPRLRHRGRRCRPDPRRPGEDRPPRPPLRPLLQPRRSVQRRPDRRRAADLSQRPGQAAQQPVVAPAHHPAAGHRPQPPAPPHRPARLHVGRQPVEPRPGRVPLRHPPRQRRRQGVHGRHGHARCPCIRADWFVATASRPPLYHDLLQLPTNLAELEAQLRVDAAGGHPAGARRPCRLQRLGHRQEQPHPGAARRGSRGLLAHLRLRGGAAEPGRSRQPAARSAQPVRLPARPRLDRQPVPARRRRGHLQPAQRPAGATCSSTPTTSASTRRRPPSSATPSGPTRRSRTASRACRATTAASTTRTTRSAITSTRTRRRSRKAMPS